VELARPIGDAYTLQRSPVTNALKRGINGASETVVIDVSFPLAVGETPSGAETSAKNLNESAYLGESKIFFVPQVL
jgi:hypothetical protein